MTARRRLTPLDIVLLATLAVVTGGGYVLRAVFRPPDPVVFEVEPNEIRSAPATLRVVGLGLRAGFVARLERDGPRALPRPLDPTSRPEGAYVVGFTVQRDDAATMVIPAVPAGVYDLAVYEQALEVARLPRALRVMGAAPR